MLMTPEMYVESLNDKSLEEMITARNHLIDDIREYEDAIRKGYDVVMTPDPKYVYKNNHMCLIEVSRLIYQKLKI